MELKNCKCGQQVEFSWDDECKQCSIRFCECGQEMPHRWSEKCSLCQKKHDTKENIQIFVGVIVAILLISLAYALSVEYEIQIQNFFTGIELSLSNFYYSLSDFVQNFLKALSLILATVFFIGLFGFMLVFSTSSSRF